MEVKRKHVKSVVGFTATWSVATVVGSAVASVTPNMTGAWGIYYKVTGMIGSGVLAGVLRKPVRKYTDRLIDDICDQYDLLEDEKKSEPRYYPR